MPSQIPRLPGLLLVASLSALACALTQGLGLARYGLSALTLAIALGALLGNLRPACSQGRFAWGLDAAQRHGLRWGVALYGLNLSLQQIAQVGPRAIVIDLVMVCSTLALGWFVGTRVLGMDRASTVLTAAGSAICGAAAVVATAPVLAMDAEQRARHTATAVATVVLFGSAAMVLYPVLLSHLAGSPTLQGVYVGSTVHEVAQVVAVGSQLGADGARSALIVKMIRVMLLVPFLLTVSALNRGPAGHARPITIPWFALAFVGCAALHSLNWLPQPLTDALRLLSTLLLGWAMAALGLNSTLARIRAAGWRPLALGGVLFVHLTVTGGWVNRALAG